MLQSKPSRRQKGGFGSSLYLLKWTLGLDAFPTYKDPVIPEAQIADRRAAEISDQFPSFIVEPIEQRRHYFRATPIFTLHESSLKEEASFKKTKSIYLVAGSSKEAIMTTTPSWISFKNLIKGATSAKISQSSTQHTLDRMVLKPEENSPPPHMSKKAVWITVPVFPEGAEYWFILKE